jgi:hypothetical protein
VKIRLYFNVSNTFSFEADGFILLSGFVCDTQEFWLWIDQFLKILRQGDFSCWYVNQDVVEIKFLGNTNAYS